MKNDTVVMDRIEGYLITFTEEEKESVFDMLYDEGYSTDLEGLKKWILDNANGEPDPKENTPSPADRIAVNLNKMIIDNPEKIIEAGIRVGEGIQKIIGAIKKGR